MQKGVNLRPTVSFAFSNNNTQVSSSFLCLTTPSNNACSLPWTTSTSTPEVFWARRVGNESVSHSYVSRFSTLGPFLIVSQHTLSVSCLPRRKIWSCLDSESFRPKFLPAPTGQPAEGQTPSHIDGFAIKFLASCLYTYTIALQSLRREKFSCRGPPSCYLNALSYPPRLLPLVTLLAPNYWSSFQCIILAIKSRTLLVENKAWTY